MNILNAHLDQLLRDSLQPVYLEILNESHLHARGANPNSHFKIIVVSSQFEHCPLVKRHQLLHQLLAELRQTYHIHAIGLHLFTPSEWENKNNVSPQSPSCQHRQHS